MDVEGKVIVVVDPGVTTGYAVMDYIPGLDPESLTKDMVKDMGMLSMWRGIDVILDQWKEKIHALVIEQYRLYRGRAAQAQGFSTIEAARVIGAVLYMAEERGISVIEQGASITKGMRIPDEVFAGLKGPHIKDAVMHGMVYLMSRKEK
jgi:hypothetical protein